MLTSITNFFKELLAGRVFKGLARTAIAALSGWLLAKGVSTETVTEFAGALTKVTEALIPLLGVAVWSVVDKYKSVNQKELDKAQTGLTVKDIKDDAKQ